MKLDEICNLPAPILEGVKLEVYEELIPLLMIEDDAGIGSDPGSGGGDMITPQPADSPPVVPPPGPPKPDPTPTPPPTPATRSDGGWGPGPFHGPGVGFGGAHWFNEFYNTIRHLVIANNITKRMKELGISSSGQKRVKQAAHTAAKQVHNLLTNPQATAYRIPTWTFDKPKTPVIKRWNEGFAHEFKRELAKLNEQQILD